MTGLSLRFDVRGAPLARVCEVDADEAAFVGVGVPTPPPC